MKFTTNLHTKIQNAIEEKVDEDIKQKIRNCNNRNKDTKLHNTLN